MNSIDSYVSEFWIFIVIRIYEFNRWIVFWIALCTCIDPFPIENWSHCEIFISFEHTYHVFHCVCVGSCECSIALPKCNFINFKHGLHNWWQFIILIHLTRWFWKTVIIMICPISNFIWIQKFLISHIDSFSSISKISKPIIFLSFRPNNFFSCHFSQVSFILPLSICILNLSIIFKKTWPSLADIINIEIFLCNCSIITNIYILIIWKIKRIWSYIINKCCLIIKICTYKLV